MGRDAHWKPAQGSAPLMAAIPLRLTVPRIFALDRNCPSVWKKSCEFPGSLEIRSGVGTQAKFVAALRTRVHSVLLKKNSLFLMTGPSAEKPKLLRSKTDFGTPNALFWKEFDEKRE